MPKTKKWSNPKGKKKPTYYQYEIGRILTKEPKPDGNRYKLKVTGEKTETRWLDITPSELKKIKKILKRY